MSKLKSILNNLSFFDNTIRIINFHKKIFFHIAKEKLHFRDTSYQNFNHLFYITFYIYHGTY